MFEIVFSFNVLSIIYFHIYILLDFPITYRNASVLCQSECACLHKIVNMVVFFVDMLVSIQQLKKKKGTYTSLNGPFCVCLDFLLDLRIAKMKTKWLNVTCSEIPNFPASPM